MAISSYGPLLARIPLANQSDALQLQMTGEYPFEDDVNIALSGLPDGPVVLPLYLRVPSWATHAVLSFNGMHSVPIGQHNGTMLRVDWPQSLTGTNVMMKVAMNPAIRVEAYYNNSLSVYRGALLYALQLGENVKIIEKYAGGARDYNITLDSTSTPWNVALVVEPGNLTAGMAFHRSGSVPSVPFSSGKSPVSIVATARVLNSWPVELNAAGPPPRSPVPCGDGACGEPFQVTLVPFGSTHLRVAEMPFTYDTGDMRT